MILKNKYKKATALIIGSIVIFIFTFLSINLSLYFLIGILFSCGILLTQFGVQLDIENYRYREYIGFLGVKKGEWIRIDRKMKLEINKNAVLNPTFGKKTHKIYYNLNLINMGEKSTIQLCESSDLEMLKNLQNDFCQRLKLECT